MPYTYLLISHSKKHPAYICSWCGRTFKPYVAIFSHSTPSQALDKYKNSMVCRRRERLLRSAPVQSPPIKYSFRSLAASESSSFFPPLYIIAGFLLECNCLRTPWDTTKLSHNASLRFAGPETLIWQPCTLELNSKNGSVLINIKLRAERKILALCKHTDPEDYLKMLLYIFISKRANKSDKLIIWFHHISICYGGFYPHRTPSYHRAGWKDHSAHNQRKPTLFFEIL